MSWIDLPATAGTDWQDLAFAGQFAKALNERRLADNLGVTPYEDLEEGADLQARLGTPNASQVGWVTLQSQLQGLATSYVNSADYPDGFEFEEEVELYTLARWRELAGIHEDGFERRLPRTIAATDDPGSEGDRAYWGSQDSDHTGLSAGARRLKYEHDGSAWVVAEDQAASVDEVVRYGVMQPGDYIGPWIFNELHAGIDLLRWTHHGASNAASSQTRTRSDEYPTWAEAQANFDDDPLSESGSRTFSAGAHIGSGYRATVAGYRLVVTPQPLWTGAASSLICYVRVSDAGFSGPVNVFDPLDVSWVTEAHEDLCAVMVDESPATDAQRGPWEEDQSAWTPPPWCDDPTSPKPGPDINNNDRGHAFSGTWVVARWDVAGGFEYVD